MSTDTPRLPGCLVLLNGFPGVGKLAIARSLHSSLADIETRIIDNNLIIDPAEAIHPGRGHQYRVFRDRLRRVLFDELKTIPGRDTVLIMTCSLGANAEDAAVFAEHLEVWKLTVWIVSALRVYHSFHRYNCNVKADQNSFGFRLLDTGASRATCSR